MVVARASLQLATAEPPRSTPPSPRVPRALVMQGLTGYQAGYIKTLHSAPCTLHSAQLHCTLCTVLCTLCTLHSALRFPHRSTSTRPQYALKVRRLCGGKWRCARRNGTEFGVVEGLGGRVLRVAEWPLGGGHAEAASAPRRGACALPVSVRVARGRPEGGLREAPGL